MKHMESLSVLIEEIKAALREYVREIVREEVRAALNVGAHELTVKYRLKARHRPHDILTNTKPITLQFIDDFREISAWDELLPALANMLVKPYERDYTRSADATWTATRKFLTECGYICGADEYRELDKNVESVSISLSTKVKR